MQNLELNCVLNDFVDSELIYGGARYLVSYNIQKKQKIKYNK